MPDSAESLFVFDSIQADRKLTCWLRGITWCNRRSLSDVSVHTIITVHSQLQWNKVKKTGGESDTSVNEKIKFRKQIQKIKHFSSRALEANNGREIMNIVL